LAIVIPSPLVGASQNLGRARIVRVTDREIRAHNGRVGDLCVRIARQLGMTPSEQRVLARSGLLHDIGTLAIPGAILHKHDPLVGMRILQWAGHFERALLAVLHHHERMDGSGYPHGLVGDAIPIEARVVAVADMYDVLTSDRPYRRARTDREARRILEAEAGPHLDPHIVSALLQTLDNGGSRPAPAFD